MVRVKSGFPRDAELYKVNARQKQISRLWVVNDCKNLFPQL